VTELQTPTALEPRAAAAPTADTRAWLVVHLCTLVAVVPVLFWINRDQWFAGDEWQVITTNGLGSSPPRASIFAPHFEHWSTLGVLVYRALYAVFELHTYVPYTAVLIVVILGVTRMLWRLLLRISVVPAYATAVALVFPVLAVGWENRSTAWQITIIAPVGLGFAALLLMPERGPLGRRDLVASLLLVVGLMCSGVGVTMTVTVVIAALLRRGWRVAAALLALPAVVYLTWYVLEGTVGQRNTVALSTALRDLPDFVWTGLTGALSGFTRVPGTGAVVLVLAAAWLVWRARPRHEPWPLVIATAIGAVVSISLTGLRRAGVDAEASRYADIVVVLLLPTIALATQDVGRLVIRRLGRPAVAAFTVVVLAFLAVQVVGLNHEVETEVFVGEMKPRVLATAKILRAGEPIASTNIFGIPFLTEPSTATIARIDRHGELPALDVSRADVLTAREYVETTLGAEVRYPEGVASLVGVSGGRATAGAAPGCVDVTATRATAPATARLRLPAAASFRITTRRPQAVSLRLAAAGATGRPRPFDVDPEQGIVVSVARGGMDVLLTFSAPTATLCSLAGPSPA
jgi:hypothetical protein